MTVRPILIALALLAPPPRAAAADPSCLWSRLTPVAQARIELAARLGDGVPVSVITRFGADGVGRLLRSCGYDDSFDDFQRASAVWIASASHQVARARARLAGFDPDALDEAEDAAAATASLKRLAEAVMRRERGVAEPILLAAIDRATDGGDYSSAQRRLAVEYLVARLILRGLEAGAEPPAPPVDAGN